MMLGKTIIHLIKDIYNILFSTKIQDGHQLWQKLKCLPFGLDTLVLPYGSKIR